MKLVVAEKPSVAKSYAEVLGADSKKNGYYEGNGYIVTWCYGHLVALAQPEDYGIDEWQRWSYEALPLLPSPWKYVVLSGSKDQYKVVKSLMNDDRVTETVNGTDAGREGEYIFRLVYNQAGCNKPILRLWTSSMEDSALKEGFEHLEPGEKYEDLYQSAVCRARADWLVGMNGSRLFTVLYKTKLNVGRVQTPTLNMIVEREKAIAGFKKEPFYTVHLMSETGIDAVSERFKDKAEAEKIEKLCDGSTAKVESVTKEEKSVQPPKLYDLTSLQRDANRLFGYTAKQTLDTVQALYEKKLCTYPRTDAQFLTDDMGETARNVVEAVQEFILHDDKPFLPDVDRVLNSKKVSDHHAIIPTMEIAKKDLSELSATEMKILFTIAVRLICATGEKHIYESVKALIGCEGNTFTATGRTVVKDGWKAYEDRFKKSNKADKEEDKEEEKALPEMSDGMTFTASTKTAEGFTQPPKHFTEDSLLSAMERAGADEMDDEVERKGLGTTATRADIIERLIKNGYVRRDKKQLLSTEDGVNLISILPDSVKSPKLTADWENDLLFVSKGEKTAEEFMNGIVDMVSDLVRDNSTASNTELFARDQETLGKCPFCGGKIVWHKEYGAYCANKCGMNVGRCMGKQLSKDEVTSMLNGKKFLLKGLVSKAKGTKYDAYIIPDGIEPYTSSATGKEGFQFKIKMEFPERAKKGGYNGKKK